MGELALATSNIVLSINTLAFMPVIGMGIASSILVGQYMGRREPEHAERAGWTSLKMGLGYMLAIGLTYVLFPSFYVSLFTGGGPDSLTLPEVLPMARWLMIMLAVWGTADACDLILAGALKGAGDTRFVMYYSLALAWGMLVVGQLILVLALRQGIYVSWIWTCLYIVVMAVGYLVRFRRGRWKAIRLLERNESLLPPGGSPGADALLTGE
jgi:MATE family multidrug resistance protein